ncbi:MAG TPA: hypothetical protein VM802_31600 [Chitinophaga sp.]|uniref:hypothetical protein n=1 Tax=Chitinophaga sp. TaxID=1869181 RepID=UPI002B8C0439|nr:hypothetical protein [Chitinophaga sp.]HVI49454.1 hypothetical protein [Chitinophaga sp.]
MKKLLTLLLISAASSTLLAVSPFQTPAMNVEGTASSIVSKLDKTLLLTDKQKPKLLSIISGYLHQRVNIQSLQHSNETAYRTKLNSMQNGLHTRLKPLLTLTQYTEFLGQKPKLPDETNVLTQLYY